MSDSIKMKEKGIERRRSYRIPVKIGLRFTDENKRKRFETKNINRYGFLFESQDRFVIGAILVMDMKLPRNFFSYRIPIIVKVVRVTELPGGRFDVGVEVVKISAADLDKIIKYALSHQNEQAQVT